MGAVTNLDEKTGKLLLQMDYNWKELKTSMEGKILPLEYLIFGGGKLQGIVDYLSKGFVSEFLELKQLNELVISPWNEYEATYLRIDFRKLNCNQQIRWKVWCKGAGSYCLVVFNRKKTGGSY